jgi:hypothetical protein
MKKIITTTLLALTVSTNVAAAEAKTKTHAESAISARSGPSAEETMSFITGIANSSGDYSRSDEHSYSRNGVNNVHETISYKAPSFSFSDNRMKVIERSHIFSMFTGDWSAGFGKLIYDYDKEYTSEARLHDLSPVVEVQESQIIVSCSASACFDVTDVAKAGGERFGRKISADKVEARQENKQYYTFANADTAQKVAKALKHLIEINGGKASLF